MEFVMYLICSPRCVYPYFKLEFSNKSRSRVKTSYQTIFHQIAVRRDTVFMNQYAFSRVRDFGGRRRWNLF